MSSTSTFQSKPRRINVKFPDGSFLNYTEGSILPKETQDKLDQYQKSLSVQDVFQAISTSTGSSTPSQSIASPSKSTFKKFATPILPSTTSTTVASTSPLVPTYPPVTAESLYTKEQPQSIFPPLEFGTYGSTSTTTPSKITSFESLTEPKSIRSFISPYGLPTTTVPSYTTQSSSLKLNFNQPTGGMPTGSIYGSANKPIFIDPVKLSQRKSLWATIQQGTKQENERNTHWGGTEVIQLLSTPSGFTTTSKNYNPKYHNRQFTSRKGSPNHPIYISREPPKEDIYLRVIALEDDNV